MHRSPSIGNNSNYSYYFDIITLLRLNDYRHRRRFKVYVHVQYAYVICVLIHLIGLLVIKRHDSSFGIKITGIGTGARKTDKY